MAIIKKCDTCDAVSPDKEGLHVANHWTMVEVASCLRRNDKDEYLICTDCLRKGIRLSDRGLSRA